MSAPLVGALLSPVRRPGSLRRTLTVDMIRRDGISGPLLLTCRGRDLHTPDTVGPDQAGASEIGVVDVVVEVGPDRIINRVGSSTGDLSALVGRSILGGFRKAVISGFADDHARRTLLHQVLDDVPVCHMITAYIDARLPGGERKADLADGRSRLDICAGWRADSINVRRTRAATGEAMQPGPVAVPLAEDDPMAWHSFEALPAMAMRRHRRFDAWFEQGRLVVDAILRDVFVEPTGVPGLIHEYHVQMHIDTDSGEIVAVHADGGALPAPDCPGALGSVQRLVGLTAVAARSFVSSQLVGNTTCTHLNDTLRFMSDAVVVCDGVVVP